MNETEGQQQEHRQDERVEARAEELNTEEERAGSDDPEAQARAILDDSDERTRDRHDRIPTDAERRAAEEIVPPPDE